MSQESTREVIALTVDTVRTLRGVILTAIEAGRPLGVEAIIDLAGDALIRLYEEVEARGLLDELDEDKTAVWTMMRTFLVEDLMFVQAHGPIDKRPMN